MKAKASATPQLKVPKTGSSRTTPSAYSIRSGGAMSNGARSPLVAQTAHKPSATKLSTDSHTPTSGGKVFIPTVVPRDSETKPASAGTGAGRVSHTRIPSLGSNGASARMKPAGLSVTPSSSIAGGKSGEPSASGSTGPAANNQRHRPILTGMGAGSSKPPTGQTSPPGPVTKYIGQPSPSGRPPSAAASPASVYHSPSSSPALAVNVATPSPRPGRSNSLGSSRLPSPSTSRAGSAAGGQVAEPPAAAGSSHSFGAARAGSAASSSRSAALAALRNHSKLPAAVQPASMELNSHSSEAPQPPRTPVLADKPAINTQPGKVVSLVASAASTPAGTANGHAAQTPRGTSTGRKAVQSTTIANNRTGSAMDRDSRPPSLVPSPKAVSLADGDTPVALTAQRFFHGTGATTGLARGTSPRDSPLATGSRASLVDSDAEELYSEAQLLPKGSGLDENGSISIPDSLQKVVSARAGSLGSMLNGDVDGLDGAGVGVNGGWAMRRTSQSGDDVDAVGEYDHDHLVVEHEDEMENDDMDELEQAEGDAAGERNGTALEDTARSSGASVARDGQGGWASLPAMCLQGISQHLPLGAQLASRLVCRGWQRGVYMAGMVRELPASACFEDMHLMDMMAGRQHLLLRVPTVNLQIWVAASSVLPLTLQVEPSSEGNVTRGPARTLSGGRSAQLAAAAAAVPLPDIRADLLQPSTTTSLQLLSALHIESAGMFEPLDPMLDQLSSLTRLTSLSISMKLSGSYNFASCTRGRGEGRMSEHLVNSSDRALQALQPLLAIPNLRELALVVHVGILVSSTDVTSWLAWASAAGKIMMNPGTASAGGQLSRLMVAVDEPGERVLQRGLVSQAGKDWGVPGAAPVGGNKSFLMLTKADGEWLDDERGGNAAGRVADAEVVICRPMGGSEVLTILDTLLQSSMDAQPPCHMRLTHLGVALSSSVDVVQVCDQAALLDLQRMSLGIPVDMDWLNALSMQQDLPALGQLSNIMLYTTTGGSSQQAQSMWELQNVDHVYLPTMCTTLATLPSLSALSVRCGLSTSSRASYATSLLALTNLRQLELVNDKRRFSCTLAMAWLPQSLRSLVVEQLNLYHPVPATGSTTGSIQEQVDDSPVLTLLEELTLRTTTVLVAGEHRLACFTSLRSATLDNVFIHLPSEPTSGGERSTRAAAQPLSLATVCNAWPQLTSLEYRMSSHRAGRCSLEPLAQLTGLSSLGVLVPSFNMEWGGLAGLGRLQCLTHLAICVGLDCGVDMFEQLTSNLNHLKVLRLEGKDIREQLTQQLSQHLGPKPMWWIKQKLGPRTDIVWV